MRFLTQSSCSSHIDLDDHRIGDDLEGRPVLYLLAKVQHHQPVGHVRNDLEVVLDNEQRNPFLTDPAHELDHAGEAALIEPSHNFIHEQEPRPRCKGSGELEPLALSGAEPVSNRVQAVGQADKG